MWKNSSTFFFFLFYFFHFIIIFLSPFCPLSLLHLSLFTLYLLPHCLANSNAYTWVFSHGSLTHLSCMLKTRTHQFLVCQPLSLSLYHTVNPKLSLTIFFTPFKRERERDNPPTLFLFLTLIFHLIHISTVLIRSLSPIAYYVDSLVVGRVMGDVVRHVIAGR